jgi:hypothetical protein
MAAKAYLPLDEALILAANIFAPMFDCSVEEFHNLLVDLDRKGFLTDELRYTLQRATREEPWTKRNTG